MMHVSKRKLNIFVGLLLILASLFAVVIFRTSIIPGVKALECKKYGSVCGWTGWNSNPKPCSSGDPGAKYLCCFWSTANRATQKCQSVGPNKCACGNVYYVCGGSSGGGGSTPTPTQCSCSPRDCAPGRAPNKFMTVSVSTGLTGKSCGNPCSPSTYNCPNVNANAAPSCSILPTEISINRGDAPKAFSMTTTDPDYGDEVAVTAVRIKDVFGQLNTCVDVIRGIGGEDLLGATARPGSDNPGATSVTNTYYVDARTARGVYANINGQSVCKGTITVEVLDKDSDLSGPDSSAPAQCTVGITVTDKPPQLLGVSLKDQDTQSDIRDQGAAKDLNLIDGRNQLYVGSSRTSETKSRAATCKGELTLLEPLIKCRGGDEVYGDYSQRRNPLSLEFTVGDLNGAADIMKAGVWIQRTALNKDNVALPTFDGVKRNSFQLSYSEDEIKQRVPNSNDLYCYKPTADVPEVVTSTVCPTDCAACARKEGVSAIPGNPNALLFKVGLYFNDKDGGSGMTEEAYSIFLSALDTVKVPLYHVTGKGADGWVKFTKDGTPCTGATCAANTDFSLLYDTTAPLVSYMKWEPQGENGINVTFDLTEALAGSGLAGVTNRYMAKQETLDGEPLGDKEWARNVSDGQPFDGKADIDTTISASVVLSGDNFVSGEQAVAGLCVYDKAGNMGCGKNYKPYTFQWPWLKTSYGDIFSAKGGSAPFSQTLPSEDTSVSPVVTDNTRSKYAPYTEQRFTVGTGLIMTEGAFSQGYGMIGGYSVTDSSPQFQAGFKGNYRLESDSKYNIFGHTPFLQGNEYSRLRSIAISNCDLLNSGTAGSCQASGNLTTIGNAATNIIYVSNDSVPGFVCKRTNVIFVTGALTISGNVTKDLDFPDSGCVFVLSNTGSLTIEDTPSNKRNYAGPTPAANEYGAPVVDIFEAAIIANAGGAITVSKGQRGTTVKSADRLEIRGWVYSADTTPLFKRDLVPGDNRRFPAEAVLYDANLLDLFRPLLGTEKTVDVICGTSNHVLCKTGN